MFFQGRVVYKMASSSDFRCIVLVVVLSQVHGEVVHPPGHMQPLGSHRPMEGEIERIDYVPDSVTFYETYVREYKPIVMEGIVKDTIPLKKWTDEYLKSTFGNRTVTIEMKKKEVRGGPGGIVSMAEFIDRYQKESIYIVDQVPDGMREQVYLPGCLSCGGFLENVNTVFMWFSSGGTKSVLHTDSFHNMHCVVSGEKRFIMIPPKYTKVIGPEWEGQGYYNLDVEEVNMTAYPNMVDVPWYKAVLNPGDCLYLPYNWIHHVHSLGRNIGVNLWWVPFTFSADNCKSRTDTPNLVPLQGVELKEYVSVKIPFFDLKRDDGKVYVNDVYERFKTTVNGKDAVTKETIYQVFEVLKPGCGDAIEASYVLEMPDETLKGLYKTLMSMEEEMFDKEDIVEEDVTPHEEEWLEETTHPQDHVEL